MNMPDIQTINEQQLHLHSPVCFDWFHPYTCPYRSESPHGGEGRNKGVLIATERGLECIDCGYLQPLPRPREFSLESSLALASSLGLDVRKMLQEQRISVQQLIDAYREALSTKGAIVEGMTPEQAEQADKAWRCIDTMLLCLHRVQLALEGVETRPGREFSLSPDWITDEQHPSPGQWIEVVGRRTEHDGSHSYRIHTLPFQDWKFLPVSIGAKVLGWRPARM